MSIQPIPSNYRLSPCNNVPERNNVPVDDDSVHPLAAPSLAKIEEAITKRGSRSIYEPRFATRVARGRWQAHDARLTSARMIEKEIPMPMNNVGSAVMIQHVKGLLMSYPDLINSSAERIMLELRFQLASEDLQTWAKQNLTQLIEWERSLRTAGGLHAISTIKNGDGDLEARYPVDVDRWRTSAARPSPGDVQAATTRQLQQEWLRNNKRSEDCAATANRLRRIPRAQLLRITPDLMVAAITKAKRSFRKSVKQGDTVLEPLDREVLARVANHIAERDEEGHGTTPPGVLDE